MRSISKIRPATSYAGAATILLLFCITPFPGASAASPGPVTSRPAASRSSGPDYQPAFPIRAAFYYPWFPEVWTKGTEFPYTNYHPTLGYYDSSDLSVDQQHVQAMLYAHIDAGIASWWGQGSPTDSRIPVLLQAAAGTPFRWAIHYEPEARGTPDVSAIVDDLSYIRDNYAGDPSYLKINGKFVIFVFTAKSVDHCGMARRWVQANRQMGSPAYLVLQLYDGFTHCRWQPPGWYDYHSGHGQTDDSPYVYTIVPGFWKRDYDPRLSRSVPRWIRNIRDMIASCDPFQTIISFNEWGEGTAVESADEWSTASGYGQYLDALHSVRLRPRDRPLKPCEKHGQT